MKQILYLALQDPHQTVNGTSRRGQEFLRLLSHSFEVDLVYIEGSGQRPLPGAETGDHGALAGVRKQVRVRFRPTEYFIFSRPFLKAARSLMRERRYDYIVCDYGLCALYGLLLARKTGTPLIYSSHNLEFKSNLDKAVEDPRRLPLVAYMYAVERLAVKKAEIVIAITPGDAAYYARWTRADKILMIPQCIDETVFNVDYPAPHNDEKVILFCGNFRNQFNRDAVQVIRKYVADKVVSRNPRVKFRFVGACPPLNIRHPNFEYTGFIDDYPGELKKADLVITPLLQGRGFPTKVVEALAAGKTVISTPVGARALETDIPSLRVRSVREFPDEILRCLEENHPVDRQSFEKIRRRYTWSDNVARLIEMMGAPSLASHGERVA